MITEPAPRSPFYTLMVNRFRAAVNRRISRDAQILMISGLWSYRMFLEPPSRDFGVMEIGDRLITSQ
jgi:hypothetical protein